MNYKFYLLITIALILFCNACSSKNSADSANVKKIALEDGYKINDKNELVSNTNFKVKDIAVNTSEASTREQIKTKVDGSQITTMYDGFGNKTETRFFSDSNRLKCIIIRTAANGQKQIFVYGQGGEVKDLPADLVDKALFASATEIADSTGIFQTVKELYKPVVKQIEQPLTPLSNDKLSIQNQPIETPVLQKNQTSEQTTISLEKTPTSKLEVDSNKNTEKTPPNTKPDEEKKCC